MNYEKVYFDLISKAKERGQPNGYYEKHHIKPRSLGGDNSKSNIVKLTAKEHIFAHKLLIKFTEGEDKRKMQNAYFFMFHSHNPEREYNLNDVAYAREQCSLAKRGKPAWNKGMKMNLSSEQRAVLRETGKKNLLNVRNRDWVTAINIYTRDVVRVPKEEFDADENLVGQKTSPEKLEILSSKELTPAQKRVLLKGRPQSEMKGMVAARDVETGEHVRVSKEEFQGNPKYVGVTKGSKNPNYNPDMTWMKNLSEKDRKEMFGHKGSKNPASTEASLEKYGKMTDEEFETWCSVRTPMGVKRATTYRNRYLSQTEGVVNEQR